MQEIIFTKTNVEQIYYQDFLKLNKDGIVVQIYENKVNILVNYYSSCSSEKHIAFLQLCSENIDSMAGYNTATKGNITDIFNRINSFNENSCKFYYFNNLQDLAEAIIHNGWN